MVNISVCVEALWNDDPVEKRIRTLAALGVAAFEFWTWSNKNLDALKKAMNDTGIKLAACMFEAEKPLVDPTAGETLMNGLRKSISVVQNLGCDCLLLCTGNERKAESFEVTRRTVVRHLKRMAPLLEEHNIIVVLEPLNPIVDHLGYWLTKMSDAADICFEVESPNVRILMDLYHQQITEGNLIHTIREYAPLIGHFHSAGVPGRHELVGGELDYRAIFKAIDETGYSRYVGLEFWPVGDTETALREAQSLAST